MLDRHSFKESLRATLENHLALSHPLFGEVLDARRPRRDLLRLMALQGYQLARQFIDYLEHLHFHCPSRRFKRSLLVRLYEEETGRISGTASHRVLMEDFIAALGIPDAERDGAAPLPATRRLIDFRAAAVRVPSRYHVGAAAVLIAREGQSLESPIERPRHMQLADIYGLSAFDLQFFSVRHQEDARHVEQGINLVAELCVNSMMQREALQAVEHTCRLIHAMYADMQNAYCMNLAEA